MKEIGLRLALGLLWLLHWLPLPWLAALAHRLGGGLYHVAGSRRKVGLRNLELCFPDMPAAEREALLKQHFRWLTQSLLDRAVLWWASPERIKSLIQVEGDIDLAERVYQTEGRATMWLCPHFVGLDVAGATILLCQARPGASIYQAQSHPLMDKLMKRGRLRFGDAQIFPRSDSVKPLLRAIKEGRGFFNLPDMDFGSKDAAFVPFFGVPAATITGLPRLARLAGAAVMPCVVRILPGGEGYVLELGEAWADYPSDDVEADTRRMNAWLEGVIRTMPEQYYWVHRRFKTRPEGEPRIY